jgi:hypothetical protein
MAAVRTAAWIGRTPFPLRNEHPAEHQTRAADVAARLDLACRGLGLNDAVTRERCSALEISRASAIWPRAERAYSRKRFAAGSSG